MEKQIKETDNKFIEQVDQEFQAKRQKFRPAVYGSYHNHVAIREMFKLHNLCTQSFVGSGMRWCCERRLFEGTSNKAAMWQITF